MRRKLYSPAGDIIIDAWFEDGEDTLIVNVGQDVEPIVEENKARQSSGHDGFNQARNMRQIGEIPDTVLYGWLIADGLVPNLYQALPDKRERSAWLKKKLRDPDNRFFKTVPGRI